MGILVCGLNGSGKSTLGKALAKEIGYNFIDNEDLFFPKDNPNYLFANPRPKEEAICILMDTIKENENFVFSAVKGDYGEKIIPLYDYAVWIEVPKEIRLQRIRNRSFQKFGSRMLPGGDLYEKEEAFFAMVEGRTENYVEAWIQTLHCPVLKVDGTKSVEDIVAFITEQLHR